MNVLLSVYMLITTHAEYYTWSGNLHVVLSVYMLIVIHGVVYKTWIWSMVKVF